MNRDINKQNACEILTAMEGGDHDSIIARLTDDARFWAPISATKRGISRPVSGAREIASLFTRARHFENMHWAVEQCLAEGDWVTVHTHMQGTLKNGNHYDNWHLWLFRFDGERVAEAWEYADTAYAVEVMSSAT